MAGPPNSWWARFPDRRAAEYEAFARHGAKVRVVNETSGLLIFAVEWPVEGEKPIHLRVGFSFLHPYCRADISAPGETFARHQNPISKGLCLVAQEEGQWVAGELVADMIARQLVKLRAANDARAVKDWDTAAGIEEQLTDPLSAYFNGLGEMFSAAYLERNASVPPAAFGLVDAEVSRRGLRTEASEEAIEVVVQRFRPMKGSGSRRRSTFPSESGRGMIFPRGGRGSRSKIAGPPRNCWRGPMPRSNAPAPWRRSGRPSGTRSRTLPCRSPSAWRTMMRTIKVRHGAMGSSAS